MAPNKRRANLKLDDWWLGEINQGKGSDTSVMLYTSGTTGRPKGVILSGENLIRTAANANRFDNLTEKDEIIAYLPMAWVGDHIFSYAQCFEAGFCVACPESPATAAADRREIGPTFFFAPPRLFEAQLTDIMVRMQDAGAIQALVIRQLPSKSPSAAARKSSKAARSRCGIASSTTLATCWCTGRCAIVSASRACASATPPVKRSGPRSFRFYRSLGINLKQLYGQTEASVYITMQPDGEIYPDTVGKPAPEVEIKIDDSGEVLFRSPRRFPVLLQERRRHRCNQDA